MPIAERSGGKIKILFFIMIEVSKTKQAAQTDYSMTSAVEAETTLKTRENQKILRVWGNIFIIGG